MKRFSENFRTSLRSRLLLVILFGVVLAAAVYLLSRTGFNTYISTVYLSEKNISAREKTYIENLQEYIDEQKLSSSDTEKLSQWASRNRYVYLMIFRGDEILFTSDDPTSDIPNPFQEMGTSGITVDYPTREELKEYAAAKDLSALTVKDGLIYASFADYTEYFYYDLGNIVSVILAMVALSIVMMIYFHRVTERITRLAADVTIVSDGDMNHVIRADGNGKDEISKLSENVENMRSSILENLERERAALDANTELITSMSHDIRTPLTVLLGYLDMMKSEKNDPVMESYIKASENTALRLKKLSDDMFQYFLVFGREMDLSMQEYDAGTLIEQLFSEHIVLLSETGYDVRVGYAEPLTGTIRVDAPKFMRIIDNLFSNLTKYADKNMPITLSIEENGSEIRLVMNNRIDEHASHAESNGIGLRTCRKIADAMSLGFTIEDDGKNYCTTLTVPLVTAPATEENEK